MIMWFSKIRVQGEEHPDALRAQSKGHVFVSWHNQQFILPQLRKGGDVHTLVSDSRDGDYMAWLVKSFGKIPIRGSSSKKGVRALKQMIRLLKSGEELAIATDGPRGPAFEVKPGVVQLAQLTGAPVIALAYDASKKKQFSSWDQSFIPLLFGELSIVFDEPLYIDKSLSLEQGLDLVKQRLDLVNQIATKNLARS